MKWLEMLEAAPESLARHYVDCRELAYNNAAMAQSCHGYTLRKLARQQGYLQTQISMCENAARKRGIKLSSFLFSFEPADDPEGCPHLSEVTADGNGAYCRHCGATLA